MSFVFFDNFSALSKNAWKKQKTAEITKSELYPCILQCLDRYLPDMKIEQKEYTLQGIPVRCLCCGTVIKYSDGRKDRKFCCQDCKNTYHNRLRGKIHDVKPYVDRILVRNYNIMDVLVKTGVSQISVSQLVALGFNSAICTSFNRTRSFSELSIYDISYRVSENRVFNIRRLSLTLQQLKQL